MSALNQTVQTEYQHTLCGMIPNDWDCLSLQDVCTQITDGTHHTPKYVDSGVPFYSVESITKDNFSDTKYITEQEHNSLIKRCKPEQGDIIMSRITAGILGDTKLIDWDVDASIYVSLALLKFKKKYCAKYIYSYTRSNQFLNDVSQSGLTYATPKKINLNAIGSIYLPIPKQVEEQKAIANALSDVDALLTELENLIAKKQAIKTATMQQLLTGKTRLPQFATYTEGADKGKSKATKPSELGEIPEDWDVATLDDAANFLDGQRRPIKSGDRAKIKGQYPYYGASGIVDYVNDFIFDGEFILLGEDGENILSRSLPLAFKAKGKIWVNNHAHVMTPKEIFHIDFLIPYLESLDYSLLNSGTAQPKLNKQACLSIKVIQPSKEEQTAIATILSDMDNEIQSLEQRLKKTRQIKQGMMQELLTGRTRLPY